jgi:4-hydroxy-3-methylbut-2-enyl diphosphate reductase
MRVAMQTKADNTYFQKGFGLKPAIEAELVRDYHSALVQHLRNSDFRIDAGSITLMLAKEFGFCYGVDRAVEYAYEARKKFPERRIHITGEIIHNPHVNRRLREMEINFLSTDPSQEKNYDVVVPEDVVILPAFGVTSEAFDLLRARGCILVDTTCGSVLNVWKNVERYAREDYTSVIHGRYDHEETLATASRATRHPGGHYLVVRDMEEAEWVAGYLEEGGSPDEFRSRFRDAVSPNFDPEKHLRRIGLANQTTMLSTESMAIGERLGQAMAVRYGQEHLADHFRSFDTICSATQERQDAVLELIQEPLDVMLVIGGYNSSNTTHLAEITDAAGIPTYHIDDAGCLLSPETIRHQPVGTREEKQSSNWLPEGEVRIGITAGASTPNSRVGEVIERVLRTRNIDPTEIITPT